MTASELDELERKLRAKQLFVCTVAPLGEAANTIGKVVSDPDSQWAADAIAALRRELAGARADTGRLDWLENHRDDWQFERGAIGDKPFARLSVNGDEYEGEDMRDVIDAATAGGKP